MPEHDEITAGDAFRILECVAQEFYPHVRAVNLHSLAWICESIAAGDSGHLRGRIETLMARSGLATLLVGPKSYPPRDPALVEALGDIQ